MRGCDKKNSDGVAGRYRAVPFEGLTPSRDLGGGIGAASILNIPSETIVI